MCVTALAPSGCVKEGVDVFGAEERRDRGLSQLAGLKPSSSRGKTPTLAVQT